MKKLNILISLILLFTFFSCQKGEDNGYIIDEEIAVGEPFFTINPGAGYNNISRIAWTGQKLWALTSLEKDGGGDSSTPQKLLEINSSNGEIVQSLTPEKPMWSLDYANGKLWDLQTFVWNNEQRYAETYDISTGAYLGQWTYGGQYELYYYFTFDGTNYIGEVNYDCNGYNCQALVSYDQNGKVVKINKNNYGYEDLVFGGGYFWATEGDNGIIFKLDKDFNIVKAIKISDYVKFGKINYAGEIAMHLEYINSKLWIVDRSNNFYKTSIE